MMSLLGYLVIGFLAIGGAYYSAYLELSYGFSVFLVSAFLILYFLEWVFIKKGGAWLTAENYFVVFFSVFHFSYVLPHYFGLIEKDYEVFFVDELVPGAILYCLSCALVFMIGYRALFKRRLPFPVSTPALKVDLHSFHQLAAMFLLLSLVLFWLPIIPVWGLVFSDYKALINIGDISPLGRLFWLGQYVGYFSVAAYCVSKSPGDRFFAGHMDFILLLYIVGYFAIGDRGGFLSYAIVPLFVAIRSGYRPNLLKASLLVGVVLLLSEIVAVTRTYSVYNPVDVFGLYFAQRNEGVFVGVMHEFGSTIKTVVIAMYFFPERYDFWLGRSLLDSLSIVLPNFGEARQGGGIGVFITEAAFGPIDRTHGRGGSIAMESYANFGHLGVAFFLVLGWVVRRFERRFWAGGGVVYSITFLSLLSAIAMWMRNTSSVSFRIVVWSLLLTYLLVAASRMLSRFRYR